MNRQKSDFNNIYFKIIRIAALIMGAAFLFCACENDIEKIKSFTSPENLPVVEAENIETMFTDSGEVRFFLKAPKLLRFENEGKAFVEFPEGVELVKYDEKKQIISSITADYAKQFEKQKKWEAKNNVVATNARGDTLKTDLLIWEEEAEKIYTEEFVRIIRPDQIIYGTGFESDESLQNWKIKNPQGTIYVNLKKNENSNTRVDSVNKAVNKDLPNEQFQTPLDLNN